MAFLPDTEEERKAFLVLLRKGLPESIDRFVFGPVGDDTTDTRLERPRTDTASSGAVAGDVDGAANGKSSADMMKTIFVAAAVIVGVAVVVWILSRVVK